MPLGCGYVPVRIEPCGTRRAASADGSLTMITCGCGRERAEGLRLIVAGSFLVGWMYSGVFVPTRIGCASRCLAVSLHVADGYASIMRVPLTAVARIAGCGAAALALVGCSAGQITQTDSQFSAVDGAFGNIGNSIALRNVLIPYPHNQADSYPIGSSVPVLLSITNQGDRADELVGVDSPAASQALVEGTTQIPPGTSVTSTIGSAPISIQPASPLVVGQLRIQLTTNQVLHVGLNTPVTFQFQHAGKLTLPVPMAALSDSGG